MYPLLLKIDSAVPFETQACLESWNFTGISSFSQRMQEQGKKSHVPNRAK
jgi:hypothetical protein